MTHRDCVEVPLAADWIYEINPETNTSRLLVSIGFGGTEVARVDPADFDIEPSTAGHGDDSSYFESEDHRILTETAAAWLRAALGGA